MTQIAKEITPEFSPDIAAPITFHAKMQTLSPQKPPMLRTASGRSFHLGPANPGQVHWRDVAAHLAKLCRFGGATNTHYSVAQHSVLVADIVAARFPTGGPEAALYALLHDAHEMITGDIPAPVKDYLHRAIGWKLLDAFEHDLDEGFTRAAGLPWPVPDEIASQVHMADMIARHAEARCLLAEPARGVPPWPDLTNMKPWHKRVVPLEWGAAEELFLTRLTELAGLAGLPIRV